MEAEDRPAPPDPLDPTRMYLARMGATPLLTREGEVRIAQRIEAAQAEARQAAEDLAAAPDDLAAGRARSRMADLEARADRARHELVEANLRLVVSIAKRYVNRGLHLLDLIQEGNLGLMRAVEKFEWRRGYKFSTYATWWVRQAVSRAVTEQARTIRIPGHMLEAVHRVARASRELVQELGREPTVEEVSERSELAVDKVRLVMRIRGEPLSLDAPIGEDEDGRILDCVEDRGAPSPVVEAVEANLCDHMARALRTLPAREEKILRMRYGIGGSPALTLEEVGDRFAVTRERIRQIEAKALRHLEGGARARKLRTFLG